MKLLDMAIGVVAGYYVYTEKGRKEAQDGMITLAKMGKQMISETMQEFGVPTQQNKENDSEKETTSKQD